MDSFEYRRKWGIPDWRDESAYPGKLTDTRWRWEFLRRRMDYRQDWEFWKKDIERLDRWNLGPKKSGWEKMIPLGEKLQSAFSKYGIILDPANRNPKHLVFEKERLDRGKPYSVLRPGRLYTKMSQWAITGKREEWPCHIWPSVLLKNTAAFIFDLEKALAPQLRAAESVLREEQSMIKIAKGQRLHRESFCNYLRVYDARDSERISYQRIGKVLRPDFTYNETAPRMEEYYKTAIRLMHDFPQ